MARGKKHSKKETEQEDFRLLRKPKKIKQNKKGRLSHKKVDPDKWEEYLN